VPTLSAPASPRCRPRRPTPSGVETANLTGGVLTLTLTPGHTWADGILVHLDGPGPASLVANYLQPPVQDPAFDSSTIAKGVRDAVVLEVWRDVINGYQLPDELIEPALGGPDTTERLHTAMACGCCAWFPATPVTTSAASSTTTWGGAAS